MTLFRMENVYKTYREGTINRVDALAGVSLEINKGEMLAIVGKSGAGKSTLAHIIGTLDKPTSGECFYNYNRIMYSNDNELAKLRNKKIGFVLQDFGLIMDKTVEDNLMLPMIFNDALSMKEIKNKSAETLEALDMSELKYRLAKELSGGQKQRLAIARSMVNSPELLIADEPTGALDSVNGRMVMDIFHELNKEGTTVILITHDMSLASECSRIIELMDGRIVKD